MSNKTKEMIDLIRNSYKEGVSPATYEVDDIREVMVPMRDGIKLRTVICSPKGEGPWPVLFVRTPYPIYEFFKVHGEEYAKRGFVYVFQFCRGTVGSEGIWEPNVNEPNDGIDSVNWLAQQSWCSSIGIHGISYMALTGWIIADKLPEKVKALYLCHYGVDRYLSAYKDGLFRHDILTGWAMTNAGKQITDDFMTDYIKACLYRPHIKVDEDLWGIKLDWYRDWITHTDYDSEYWQKGFWGKLRGIPEKINVPISIVAGWFDHHLEGTVLGYEKLNNETKKYSRLIVGGWDHDFKPCIPGHKSENASFNLNADMFYWFDKILRQNWLPEPEIKTYIIGDDSWRQWESWPIETNSTKSLYFTANRHSQFNAYVLSDNNSDIPATIEYQYDPMNPVFSNGGETIFVSTERRGSLLQEEPGYRDDVISFVSHELDEDMLVVGDINVKLFVSSDCEDTCFTVKIMEVLPNGEAYNLRNGITTMAYRNNSPKRISYVPSNIEEINIKTLPITWKVSAGSRIRVDISSSNFPEYSIHSNYEGIWSTHDKTRIANQVLHIGGKYDAAIQFNIIV